MVLKNVIATGLIGVVVGLCGCGGDDGTGQSSLTAAESEIVNCPVEPALDKSDPISASAFDGIVAGVSCEKGGSLIVNRFIPAFHGEDAQTNRRGELKAAGYSCRCQPYPNRGGWQLKCEDGSRTVVFNFGVG